MPTDLSNTYNLSPDDLESGGMPYFDIYMRADNLLQRPDFLSNITLPTAYYFRIALWLFCYIWKLRDKLSLDFYHNYFDAPKNNGWVNYTDELLLINAITYQIIREKFSKAEDKMFYDLVDSKYKGILKWWIIDKEYHNAEVIWFALAGKKVNPRETKMPQEVKYILKKEFNFYDNAQNLDYSKTLNLNTGNGNTAPNTSPNKP